MDQRGHAERQQEVRLGLSGLPDGVELIVLQLNKALPGLH
jgi:hypothetical protein